MNNTYISKLDLSVYDIYIKKFLLINNDSDILKTEEIELLWISFADGYKKNGEELKHGIRVHFRVNPNFEKNLAVKNHFMLRMKQYRENKFGPDYWT